jgi:pantoate--beta-alanine ligase
MLIVRSINELNEILSKLKGKSIGFVPTMGALHEGHLSLIQKSNQKADITICSIFVNPAQFNQQSDFDHYPKTVDDDIDLLKRHNCSILFLPSVEEVYPNGYRSTTNYSLGFIENILEGKYRPGHFQGVCLVIERLLKIIPSDYLFLGQKDYQQCMVIKQLLNLIQLDKKPSIQILPTFREQTGLAMSSRNRRLSVDEKKSAAFMYKALIYIVENLRPGNEAECKEYGSQLLLTNGFDTVDYITIADAKTLEIVHNWDGERQLVVLGAAFIKDVRLIDNLLFSK